MAQGEHSEGSPFRKTENPRHRPTWDGVGRQALIYVVLAPLTASLTYFGVSDKYGYIVLACGLIVGMFVYRLGLMIYSAMLIPYMFYMDLPFRTNVSAMDLLVPAVAVSVIASGRVSSILADMPRGMRPKWVLPLYLSAFAASLLVALPHHSSGFSFDRFATESIKLLVCLAVFYLYVGAFTLAGPEDRSLFTLAWIGTATSIGLVAVLESLLSGGQTGRVRGTFEDPNLFGLYLVVSLGLVLLVWNEWRRPWLLTPAPILIMAVACTASRGALFSLTVLTAICIFLVPVRWVARLILGTSLLATVAAFRWAFRDSLPAFERLPKDGEGVQLETRYELWSVGLDLWMLSPSFGIGMGQYATEATRLMNGSDHIVAHSTPLSFLAELGVFGAAATSVPLICLLAMLLRSFKTNSQAAYLFAIWTAVIASSMTLDLQNQRFLWILLSLSAVVGFGLRSRDLDATWHQLHRGLLR